MSAGEGARVTRSVHIAAIALLSIPPAALPAQGLRGTASSAVRYLELRPLRQDTVAIDRVTVLPDGGFSFDGLPAYCEGPACTVFRSGDVQHSLLATQDANVTAWGLGVEGLSTTLLLRHRVHLDGAFRLPYTDDPLEALLAYAELSRGIYRVRAGRQLEVTGLGYSGFDGVDVLVEPSPAFRAHVYGGRSLARSVQRPLARAFRAGDEDDFVRDRDAWLVGGEVGIESNAGDMLALRYQGEIWEDRAGLLSERGLLIGRTTTFAPVVVSGSAEYDVGLRRWGTVQLDVQFPLRDRSMRIEATARRYVPFFEYWTIWGLFSPVAYHEAELRASWSPTPALGLWGSGAWRSYGAHHTQTFLRPLEGRSLRAAAGGEWRTAHGLRLDAAVRVEGPVGAFSVSTDASVAWRASERIDVTLHAVLLEQIEEFRVGSGVVAGADIGADVQVATGVRAGGGFELYRQTQPGRTGRPDWTQRRGWLSLSLEFGRDPGLPPEREP
jgi:hypothetical protein